MMGESARTGLDSVATIVLALVVGAVLSWGEVAIGWFSMPWCGMANAAGAGGVVALALAMGWTPSSLIQRMRGQRSMSGGR